MVCNSFSSALILLIVHHVELANPNAYRKALRNAFLDNIYKTENLLWNIQQCSRSCCFTSCFRHIDCRSFEFNAENGRCQVFNRDYRNQIMFAGNMAAGTLHYDLDSVDCGSSGPFINAPAADCSEIQAQGYSCSGVYTITTTRNTVLVWCDLQTDGGRWTVFQRRTDGSIDFNVGWDKYKVGFGDPSTEYWIGNDALYALTMSGTNEVLILLETWSGVWKHARYANFGVNGESDKYRLTCSGYSGTAGNSLWLHNGQQFSTKDQDNDGWPLACNPTFHTGGWWFNGCALSDLNGLYYNSATNIPNSCHWYGAINSRESLKTTFMMVRKS